jgi:hypothetical protein
MPDSSVSERDKMLYDKSIHDHDHCFWFAVKRYQEEAKKKYVMLHKELNANDDIVYQHPNKISHDEDFLEYLKENCMTRSSNADS